ncbi:hypothetical protein DM02DRAFT_612475 [Periconia macrospinosa]|uniref:NTF2-like domain-containing protein n=1 Tax=Periconia macrospinosa TaxID=97972 RepID=A0A2V1DYY7_9PLEO|nr:hypothetical protein DM02DRAFT_612475 [Periconia macrospinosa]
MKSFIPLVLLTGLTVAFPSAFAHNDDYHNNKDCLSDADATRVTNNWLGIFSGNPGLINTTLSKDVTVYDALINNGNLSAIATNREDYYKFVIKFTYPEEGVIKNAKYTLEGGGLMFHTCDKIAMRYIGHAESTGKFSAPAGTPITVAVNQLLSVNKKKEINIAWSEYDLFTMLKQVGVIQNPWGGP